MLLKKYTFAITACVYSLEIVTLTQAKHTHTHEPSHTQRENVKITLGYHFTALYNLKSNVSDK